MEKIKMAKTLKDKSIEVYENYIRDCLSWEEDPQFYISLVRGMKNHPNNFEDILKFTITFMKRHSDKLDQLTDEELTAIHLQVREKFNRPKEVRAARKRLSDKKVTVTNI
jgi:hypothetical protein